MYNITDNKNNEHWIYKQVRKQNGKWQSKEWYRYFYGINNDDNSKRN